MIEDGHADDTKLKLDLTGRNPDDGVTTIAYDKGYLFLRTLEEKVGREKWDSFLKKYFTENAFKVMTTEGFITYMNKNLFNANGLEIDESLYTNWIYGVGLPEDKATPSSDRFAKVDEAVLSYMEGSKPEQLNTDEWTSHEWLHFVRNLPEGITFEQLKQLDEAFGFTSTGNSEVLTAWLVQSIKHEYDIAYQSLENFLVNAGRRKFLVPLYGEMVKTEEGKKMALEIYSKARPNYHFVSTNTIDDMLGWDNE